MTPTQRVPDATMATEAPAGDPSLPREPDATLGELFGRVTSDIGDLVSTQVELAKVEIKEEMQRTTRSVGMLAAAAVAGLLALLAITLAAGWGLAELIDPGWAFLVVGVVWAVAAAALAASGRARLRGTEPMPETRETIKEDVRWAQQQKI